MKMPPAFSSCMIVAYRHHVRFHAGGIIMNGQFLRRMVLIRILAMTASYRAPAVAQSAGALIVTGDNLVDEGKS